MSKAGSDFRPQPRPVAPRRPAQKVPHSRQADRSPEADPRLAAALSLHNPVYPLDPPLVDVRVPVREPHAAATAYSRSALRHRFPRAQVGDDLHILFTEAGKAEEEGQTRLSPDVFVALGVPRRANRADYDVDALGPPDFVLEVLSRSTWRHDLGRKLTCYQQIGVRECLFFDATGQRRVRHGKRQQRGAPRPLAAKDLWGYALTPEQRQPLEEVVLPNGERGVRSEALGLVAYVADRVPPSTPREIWALTMRWHDPATAADIPDYDEARARADAERGRADAALREAQAERARTQAAQRRIAQLEEQLRRLRDGP